MGNRYLDALRRLKAEERKRGGYDINDLNDKSPPPADLPPFGRLYRFGRTPYERALRHLDARCPDHVEDHARWRQAVSDGTTFLAAWGGQAFALGWTVDDLFGLHPTAPLVRYDAMGLCWLLRGRKVVALTDTRAAIQSPTGAITVYGKLNKPAFESRSAIPWTISDEGRRSVLYTQSP